MTIQIDDEGEAPSSAAMAGRAMEVMLLARVEIIVPNTMVTMARFLDVGVKPSTEPAAGLVSMRRMPPLLYGVVWTPT